jgi:tetratricopeptide (TPR) repeat protein
VDALENALPLYQEVLRLDPNHASAQFAVGRLQLAQGQLEGIHWIEQAMRQDSDFRYPGCGLIAGFFQQQGKEEEARQYRRKAAKQAELRGGLRRTLRLSLKDAFASHGLMDEESSRCEISSYTSQLGGIPGTADRRASALETALCFGIVPM